MVLMNLGACPAIDTDDLPVASAWHTKSLRLKSSRRVLTLMAAALLAGGCATPASRGSAFALDHGFTREIVTGERFRHVVWRKSGPPSDRVLHFYLEGDGTPHVSPHVVARDPTPRDPVMLHLMALDPHASVYVGRPCYWGLHADAGCSSYVWTLGRFSAPVVASIVAVILKETAAYPGARVVIYGHSGGATLALLAVDRGLRPAGVVTIGGNLDPDAWTSLHGYTPLVGSLNPVREPLARLGVRLRHYVGDRDTNTPPEFVRAAAERSGGEVIVVPGFDHHCCWSQIWTQAVEFPGEPAADPAGAPPDPRRQPREGR